MTERTPQPRTGDRRKRDDPAYQGEDRRQGERRAPNPDPPEPAQS